LKGGESHYTERKKYYYRDFPRLKGGKEGFLSLTERDEKVEKALTLSLGKKGFKGLGLRELRGLQRGTWGKCVGKEKGNKKGLRLGLVTAGKGPEDSFQKDPG